jgi:hypothetical protein
MQACLPEHIAKLQREQDLRYWRIYDSSGKILMNQLIRDIGLEESIALLQEDLENTYEGFVVVRLYITKPTSRKEGDTYDPPLTRKVKLDRIGVNNIPVVSSGKDQEAYYNLKLEVEKMKWERENEKEKGDWISKVIYLAEEKPQVIKEVFTGIGAFYNMVVNKPKISAPVKIPEGTPNKLKGTLNKLAEADPEYQDTLDKLADLAKADPSLLPLLKAKLNAAFEESKINNE